MQKFAKLCKSFLPPGRKKTHRTAATATCSTPDRQKWHPHCSHSHFSDFQCSDRPFLTTRIAYRNRTVAAEIPPFWTFEPAPNASVQLHFYNESPSETHTSACRTSRLYSYRCIAEEAEFCASLKELQNRRSSGADFCDFISIMSASKSDMKPHRFPENA